jgi:hypothetical protein
MEGGPRGGEGGPRGGQLKRLTQKSPYVSIVIANAEADTVDYNNAKAPG